MSPSLSYRHLVWLSASVLGCGAQSFEPTIAPTIVPGADLMNAEQIAASRTNTAYDAIEKTHPRFLTSQIGLAPGAQREVYVNGFRIGDVSELKAIPAFDVVEVRFARPGEASRVNHSGSAILIVTKPYKAH
jgi:hypothetical protein